MCDVRVHVRACVSQDNGHDLNVNYSKVEVQNSLDTMTKPSSPAHGEFSVPISLFPSLCLSPSFSPSPMSLSFLFHN